MNILIDDYLITTHIGSGQFGSVYYANNIKDSSLIYAVKIINKKSFELNPNLENRLKSELEATFSLSHPNIVKLVDYLQSDNDHYIIYEYCNGGTLESLLKKEDFLSEEKCLYILYQILSAFCYLDSKNILHRDIKPSNILFHNGQIKIADFGFCKKVESDLDLTQSIVGSPLYMAPEILKGDQHNGKVDVWSVGILIYEVLFGICPYEDYTVYRLLNKIENNELFFPKRISNFSQQILMKMLCANPLKRPNWNNLVKFYNELVQNENISSINIKQQEQEQDREDVFVQFDWILKKKFRNFLKERNKCVCLLEVANKLIKEMKTENNELIPTFFNEVNNRYKILRNNIHIFLDCQSIEEKDKSIYISLIKKLEIEMSEIEEIKNKMLLVGKAYLVFMKKEIIDMTANLRDSMIGKKGLLLIIQLIDCLEIDNIFEIFINEEETYENSKYFIGLENYQKELLFQLYEKKLEVLKSDGIKDS